MRTRLDVSDGSGEDDSGTLVELLERKGLRSGRPGRAQKQEE
jgi:hypothetical protein